MILIRNPVMKKDTPPESQLQLSSISSWKVSGCPRVSESVDNKIHKRVNIGVMLMYAIAFKLYLIRNVAPLLWLLSDALWDCMSKSQGLQKIIESNNFLLQKKVICVNAWNFIAQYSIICLYKVWVSFFYLNIEQCHYHHHNYLQSLCILFSYLLVNIGFHGIFRTLTNAHLKFKSNT